MKYLAVLLFLFLTACGSADIDEADDCRTFGGQVVLDKNGDYAGCIEKEI